MPELRTRAVTRHLDFVSNQVYEMSNVKVSIGQIRAIDLCGYKRLVDVAKVFEDHKELFSR